MGGVWDKDNFLNKEMVDLLEWMLPVVGFEMSEQLVGCVRFIRSCSWLSFIFSKGNFDPW